MLIGQQRQCRNISREVFVIRSIAKIVASLVAMVVLVTVPTAQAAPCMSVTLTGTGTPAPFKDLAGAGTLVRYGDDSNNCSAVVMQFDAGRGTVMRLAQTGVSAAQINAVFFTHIHSDHVEGFSDIAQTRWLFGAPHNHQTRCGLQR
jgi:ribonuclease Z